MGGAVIPLVTAVIGYVGSSKTASATKKASKSQLRAQQLQLKEQKRVNEEQQAIAAKQSHEAGRASTDRAAGLGRRRRRGKGSTLFGGQTGAPEELARQSGVSTRKQGGGV